MNWRVIECLAGKILRFLKSSINLAVKKQINFYCNKNQYTVYGIQLFNVNNYFDKNAHKSVVNSWGKACFILWSNAIEFRI
jgi:hemoglobin-like flavoprotein